MKFTVKDTVLHDKKSYEPGKTIDLDEEQAARLLELKVIERAGKDQKEEPKK